MSTKVYSQRLGSITDEQFQAALDRFGLGTFLFAEPIPFGNFGQNVFVSSDKGEYVLRGQPHIWWQFPTEQFYTRLLHEQTDVLVPWPYLIDFKCLSAKKTVTSRLQATFSCLYVA